MNLSGILGGLLGGGGGGGQPKAASTAVSTVSGDNNYGRNGGGVDYLPAILAGVFLVAFFGILWLAKSRK